MTTDDHDIPTKFRTFDHIVRSEISTHDRLVAFRLIRTVQHDCDLWDTKMTRLWIEKYPPKHTVTALLISFLDDDMAAAINMPTQPPTEDEALTRIEAATNLIRQCCGGLLEVRPTDPGGDTQYPKPPGEHRTRTWTDPEVHFVHEDVRAFLALKQTTEFMDGTLKSVQGTLQTNLLKCALMVLKSSNLSTDDTWNDTWMYVTACMAIARSAEADDPTTTERLLEEMDRTLTMHHLAQSSFHWTARYPAARWPSCQKDDPRTSSFLRFAIELGLFHYVKSKLDQHGRAALENPDGRSLLSSACGKPPLSWLVKDVVQARTVKLLLDFGADPNHKPPDHGKAHRAVYQGTFHRVPGPLTPWQDALNTARTSGNKAATEMMQLGEVLKLLILANADIDMFVQWNHYLYGSLYGRHRSPRCLLRSIEMRPAYDQIEITFVKLESRSPHWVELQEQRAVYTEKEVGEIWEVGYHVLWLLEAKNKWGPAFLRKGRRLKGRWAERISSMTRSK
ncbi:hypothetical protein QBC35DRAFT_501858 [Podospora australis]|uniref:DUF7791 domain-containing protein n=1 Tax=Podospora australis TaxID=1536484 RepID=A0AAN7AGC2_9PEZI|nr:hypothetical protein QBC35DRAFT_501858 [Podospora australis]